MCYFDIMRGECIDVPPILKGMNFFDWKLRMKIWMQGKEFGVWRTCVAPMTRSEEVLNLKAMNALFYTLEPKDLIQMSRSTTAHEIWKQLEETYGRSGGEEKEGATKKAICLMVVGRKREADSESSCSSNSSDSKVCSARGPRPRYPRVWKSRKKIGTISKSQKLVDCIKGLSNLKEEVYGALDSFIAWELEFPLIVVKKALKTLEYQKEWKRIIQVIKWMLSKGQGKTMGTYYTLINALAEDGRLEEAEELFNKILSENLESLPRNFFTKMISIYCKERMHDNMIDVFADMEELGIRPEMKIVDMIGEVFQERGMMDKYEKLKKKYPPPKWEYRYIKGKRVRIRVNQLQEPNVKASTDSELGSAAEVVASTEDNGNHDAEFANPDTELDNAAAVVASTEDNGNYDAEVATPDNSMLDGAAEVISGTEYNGNCDAEFAGEDDNELVESVPDDS